MTQEVKRQTIFRVQKNKENPYLMINKTCLHDQRLSWEAKGLLCYMLSLPDDWVFRTEELATHSTGSLPSLRKILRELYEFGYLERKQQRAADGSFGGYITHVYEEPREPEPEEPLDDVQIENSNHFSTPELPDKQPEVDLPNAASPNAVKRTLLSNNINNIFYKKRFDSHSGTTVHVSYHPNHTVDGTFLKANPLPSPQPRATHLVRDDINIGNKLRGLTREQQQDILWAKQRYDESMRLR